MSLLKDVIQEMAAAGSTGAHSIAGARGSLFGGGVVDLKRVRRQQTKMMRRIMGYTVIGEGLEVNNSETQFDGSDAISKIDQAEKKSNASKDTTVFGLEDEDGGLVKVYVKTEQAEEFEQTLAAMLAGEDANNDEENSAMEIAEVLFKLKDKFEIVDVEWPKIEGDEEEEQEVEGDLDTGEETGDGTEGETGDDLDLGDGDETGDETGEDDMDAGEDAAKSALQQVIDVMKADADAKKAESEAKKAEANAKEAEYVAQASASKVQQEEEVLDMETYYKDKSDREKESKQLAKIAKYKHDKATDAETSLSMESIDRDPWRTNDDDDDDDNTITTQELATLILKNLRAN